MISSGCAVVRLRNAQRDFLKISLICRKFNINCNYLDGAIVALGLAINLINEDL